MYAEDRPVDFPKHRGKSDYSVGVTGLSRAGRDGNGHEEVFSFSSDNNNPHYPIMTVAVRVRS